MCPFPSAAVALLHMLLQPLLLDILYLFIYFWTYFNVSVGRVTVPRGALGASQVVTSRVLLARNRTLLHSLQPRTAPCQPCPGEGPWLEREGLSKNFEVIAILFDLEGLKVIL